ncbi:Outer membrane protein (porin) [Caballeronia arationis]|jgi:predicted porin|uniref:Outer membrane protein (Porin) n=1 Tax=Caballeronia arationis TaxID=1777142 RepID=A0A7Z7ICZ0_9BURK|nr:porin [Caballeronia arationis]SOE88419.1 Outer membrane protein (porin) [Caballeronia arationis]
MKREIVGIGLLSLLSGSAHAQSSVTLYGAIDAGILYQSSAAASFSPTAPNTGKIVRYKDAGMHSSIWGMQGSEDLGGGYRANFRLQGVFDSGSGKFGLSDTTGVGAAFNQIATVGISGPFGAVTIGRQFAPIINAMSTTDAREGHYFGSILTAWISISAVSGWSGTNTNVPIGALYDSNAIVYRSPKFAGMTLALEYAPGGVAGQFQGGTRESAVLQYAYGGLNLSAGYYNGHDTNLAPGVAPTGLDNNRLLYLGALYRFNGFTVSGSFSSGKNPSNTGQTDLQLYSAGFGYRFFPAFQVTSGFYYMKDMNDSANHSALYVIGADYSLSKQTQLYGQVGEVINRGRMNQMIAYGQIVAPGVSTTAAMVGIRHSF